MSCCLLAGMANVSHAQEEQTATSSDKETAHKDEAVQEGENVITLDRKSHGSLDNPSEPSNLLPRIERRGTQKESVFPVSPLGWLHDNITLLKKDLYNATNLELGFVLTHVFQGATESLPGQDDWGAATTSDLIGAWHLIDIDKPTMGQIIVHGQGRWDYGTTGPEELGTFSLGSVIGTADTFSSYTPTFILRNMYWRQGSQEAGWAYQIGKITPDGLLSSSEYLASETTFLPSGSTGPFAMALPDSGLGAVGIIHFNDRIALAGLISDTNANRFDFGDIGEGDFFKAVEFHFKVAPKTQNAGYSKITLWHTDGTSDGKAANAQLGPDGWGFYLKHEQELTDDGRLIGILRYGKSYDNAAVYDQQASVHLILKEPRLLPTLKNDLIGVAFNWAEAAIPGSRDEYNFEVFYRFPIFPHVDTTLSYQSVIDPALTREFDHVSVFSMRIRTTF